VFLACTLGDLPRFGLVFCTATLVATADLKVTAATTNSVARNTLKVQSRTHICRNETRVQPGDMSLTYLCFFSFPVISTGQVKSD
jgi:hypothetical protein